MKKSLAIFVLALSVAGAVLYVHNVYAAKSIAPWQYSEVPQIQLGVRDKFGTLGSYKAEFVVVSQKGESYKFARRVLHDEFAYGIFPQDFGGYAEPGKYTWKCVVNGKTVVSGKFVMGYSSLTVSSR